MKTDFKMHTYNTIIVGSGAAAYNAADCLYNMGQKDIAIITEGMHMGTSRNTGSDKQTYYKQTLSGKQPDSVLALAETLFQGGSMHGDIALAEAASSARCFFKLVQLGVPFPCDEYGQYAGYKTDHDPLLRATSCGPLTSKIMTECLEKTVLDKNIRIYDRYRVIHLFTEERKGERGVCGVLAVHVDAEEDSITFNAFHCLNVIYATGGPAGIYGSSVYPVSQTGSHGGAFAAGAKGSNVTEWQYGIASLKFRWNLSGSYQQVLPRYISTDKDMGDEREFLGNYFDNASDVLDAVFLKGYQWPFDPEKATGKGSSVVDMAVYNEVKNKGRRVFLDFRRNPEVLEADGTYNFSVLNEEAFSYLSNCDILFGTPVQRLKKMNRPAYQLYLDHNIDLEQDLLEIDVCAQHNNGGLQTDVWWQSNVKGLFPVGEAAGTFGVYRPGGTALNSTQVGSLRAAQYIAGNCKGKPAAAEMFADKCKSIVGQYQGFCRELCKWKEGKVSPRDLRKQYQKEMDACGGFIRSQELIDAQIDRIKHYLETISKDTYVRNSSEVLQSFINKDILITQLVYLNGMKDYIEKGGYSRGSFLVTGSDGKPVYSDSEKEFSKTVQEVELKDEYNVEVSYANVRPVPDAEIWFEELYNKCR